MTSDNKEKLYESLHNNRKRWRILMATISSYVNKKASFLIVSVVDCMYTET